ncbi:hypothetical protein OSH11_05920 [Kaistia dalseonensis]|uniref:Uncharacterized protein n=1 Tax=Kaistia dalseonensis TaxID=410840 RepID=A0ABU0H3C8_9HYPH|nr:hypothetical protein [Kaistia dalseonensis]MCX5494228.1 hypothetical protein [Kaistia dalseonensis]MDQ0436807.1 hypothetical protein [Kaistia dalseonensis]
MGGSIRTVQGNYFDAFIIAGSTGLIAAAIALLIKRPRQQAVAVGAA